MPRRFNKERYFNEDSYRIPLTKLNKVTYNNVKMLGDYLHIDWDDEATVTPQPGTGSPGWSPEKIDAAIAGIPSTQARIDSWLENNPGEEPPYHFRDWFEAEYKQSVKFYQSRKRGHQPVKTFIIEGIGPHGEEVVYLRRETGSSIGGTHLYIDGSRFQVSRMIERFKERNPNAPETKTFEPFLGLENLEEFPAEDL